MTEVAIEVPAIPELSGELLDDWLDAHQCLAEGTSTLEAGLATMYGRWLRDHTVTALAGVYPSISGTGAPALFPPPRAFLSDRQVARIEGTLEAYRYLDVQVTLHRQGLEPLPLRIETPFILHALVEGRSTGSEETNPAILRTRTSTWVAKVSPYAHPPAWTVRPLVERIIQRAATAEDAAPAVAGWMAFCWMSLHPWVDGNGRTARLLYLLHAARRTPFLDLGAVEQMTFHRSEYTMALQRGQWTTPTWDATLLDAEPFASLVTRWSASGARLNLRRLEAYRACAEQIATLVPGLDPMSTGLVLRAGIDRMVHVDQLVEPAVTEEDEGLPMMDAWLEGLVELGALVRRPLPPSRRVSGRPGIGYSPAPLVAEPISRLLAMS